MATVDLYIDTFSQKLVAGLLDSTTVSLPKFIQGDTPTLKIWLLTPLTGSAITSPFEYVPVTGITLQAAIGTRVGNSTTYYTQQFSWTASTDPDDPYFTATFPLNTAAITTLLGSSSSVQTAFFEVKMVQSGVPTTIYSEACTVQAAVIKDGGTTIPELGTPISAETAAATFVGREHVGYFILVCDTDNTKKLKCYCGADGLMHFDPVV